MGIGIAVTLLMSIVLLAIACFVFGSRFTRRVKGIRGLAAIGDGPASPDIANQSTRPDGFIKSKIATIESTAYGSAPPMHAPPHVVAAALTVDPYHEMPGGGQAEFQLQGQGSIPRKQLAATATREI